LSKLSISISSQGRLITGKWKIVGTMRLAEQPLDADGNSLGKLEELGVAED